MSNTIVIYFSHSANDSSFAGVDARLKGNTQIAVEAIQKELSCDVFRVELSNKYDGMVWHTNRKKLKRTMRGKGLETKELLDNIDGYEYVFICGPCWWCSYPTAIYAQMNRLNFRGKKVMCLVTHEGIRPDSCVTDARKKAKGARFGDSYIVRGDEVQQHLLQIARWAQLQVAE